MKIKNLIIGIMSLILLVSFVSAEYRWVNTSNCVNNTGVPDGSYFNVGATGVGCISEDINLSGLNVLGSYNVSFVYVFNISEQFNNDYVKVQYCKNSSVCLPTTNLIIYDNTNTPVDFLNNYLSINFGFLNYTELQNLRLQIKYELMPPAENVVTRVDTMGIDIFFCEENWIVNYTACNVSDNRIKFYDDLSECGTFDDLPVDNGTIVSCDYCISTWYCAEFDGNCGVGVSEISCINVTYQNPSCCQETNLSSDCIYSGNYSDYDMYCGDIEAILVVPTYPYVDFNISYPMALIVTQDNVTFNEPNFKINITSPDGNTTIFNWTWDAVDERYEKTFIFTKIGDYPFLIFADYPYSNIPTISGTLIVRKPFYVTFEGFETKNQQIKPYDNDFAYVIAEKTDKMYYDKTLESFIVPLFFSLGYDTSVFHAPYIDGQATLKLWENDTNYAVRIIDGLVDFESSYSSPNIVDSYGANIYLGKFSWNGSQDETIKVYLEEKDINQYRWLFNWVFIIALVLIIATAIFMFFVIPEYSQLSIIFGLGFVCMLVVGRIVMWLIFGW